MKAFFNYIYWLFVGRPVKQKLRTGALYSLKMYIKTISGARKAAMMSVLGIMGLASITIGFFMLIGGLLWFANLNPQAYPWIMVVVGGLLTIAGIAGYIFAFRQKLWVEMSRINEFTSQALAKLPANERPANPAVTGLWSLATEVRLREEARLAGVVPGATAAMAANPNSEIARRKSHFDILMNTEVPDVEHLDSTKQKQDHRMDPALSPVY